MFALGFALFLFSLTCLVADPRISTCGRGASRPPRSWARNPAPIGRSAVPVQRDGSCPHGARARARCRSSTSARRIARARCTRSSARASRPAISRRRSRVDAAHPTRAEDADDPQVPDGTLCASDGCHVYAEVSRVVQLPIPLPGFPGDHHCARHRLRGAGGRHERRDDRRARDRLGARAAAALSARHVTTSLSSGDADS